MVRFLNTICRKRDAGLRARVEEMRALVFPSPLGLSATSSRSRQPRFLVFEWGPRSLPTPRQRQASPAAWVWRPNAPRGFSERDVTCRCSLHSPEKAGWLFSMFVAFAFFYWDQSHDGKK